MLAQRRNDERVVELHVERPASDALFGASSMPMISPTQEFSRTDAKVGTLPDRMFKLWSCRGFDRKRLRLCVPREIHPDGPSLTTFWPKLLQASLFRR